MSRLPAFDVLVLGAGIVGVSVALHLQERGKRVALVDRRAPGEETSYGNAGFIELSAILPHPFPKGMGNLIKLALNRSPAVRADYLHLPRILPWMLAYKRASADRALAAIGPAFRTLIGASLDAHRDLMRQAGASELLSEEGWLELCRTAKDLDEADAQAEGARRLGVSAHRIDAEALRMMEPALVSAFAGAIYWADTARVTDPGGLVHKLADLFVARGGAFERTDALACRPGEAGWALPTATGLLQASEVVVALGPWSADFLRPLGYRFPLVAKRGYHQHFETASGPPLSRAIYVRDRSCLIVPARQGVRVLSGVELAARDAPPTPVQLARMIGCARETLALGSAIEERPWLGSRPCLPDMLPVIGKASRHPGLWFAFGHGHYGFTQGPLTGRLIAELLTNKKPLVPVAPFAAERFEGPRLFA